MQFWNLCQLKGLWLHFLLVSISQIDQTDTMSPFRQSGSPLSVCWLPCHRAQSPAQPVPVFTNIAFSGRALALPPHDTGLCCPSQRHNKRTASNSYLINGFGIAFKGIVLFVCLFVCLLVCLFDLRFVGWLTLFFSVARVFFQQITP